jgi:hypothetical protein
LRANSSSRLTGALLLSAALAAPLSAQQSAPRLEVSPFAGTGVRQSSGGLRVAEDIWLYGVRVTRPRLGFQPWVEVAALDRPNLDCVPDLACNDSGWVLRVGATAPLTPVPYRPGVHPRLMIGIGAAFSEETTLSHVLGLGLDWRLGRILAPFLETRWEHLPGIDILMVNVGLNVAVPYPRRGAEEEGDA